MKNILYKLFYTSLIIGLLSSCDVLDREPDSLIPTTEAIVDAQSAGAAVNGLYHALQSGDLYGGRFIMANEMVAQNGRATAFQAYWKELESGTIPTSNFHVEDSWVAFYNVINSANTIIEALPNITGITEDDKNEMLGTAYFFRALSHFDLLRQFGEFYDTGSTFGIPLKLSPSLSIEETPRSTVSESYTQIENDINQAISLLADHGDKFYVSQGAAQALMARVTLYQNKYADAITFAETVINNSKYNLEANYNDIYINEGSNESIFELNFIVLDDPNVWATEMYIAPPEVSVSSELISFLNNRGETERNILFDDFDGLARCIKYGTTREETGGNTIIARLSEMYLIRAEALGKSGTANDALSDLNTVRNRAGLSSINSIGSQTDLTELLLEERRAEFAFEGHYWFDMVRLGKMEEMTGRESFRRVFPIPQRELNITAGIMIQNPGY